MQGRPLKRGGQSGTTRGMLADYGAGSPGSPLTSGPTYFTGQRQAYLLDGEEMYRLCHISPVGFFPSPSEKEEKKTILNPRIFSAGVE